MDYQLQETLVNIEDSLQGYSGVSGSSIVCSSEVQVIEVRSPADFLQYYNPISSSALCIMVILLFAYKKFLDVIKSIISSMFKEVFRKYDRI